MARNVQIKEAKPEEEMVAASTCPLGTIIIAGEDSAYICMGNLWLNLETRLKCLSVEGHLAPAGSIITITV